MRKHGPTPKPSDQLRTVRVNLLLTPAEHDALILLAGSNRKQVSEHIRRAIFNQESGKIPEVNLTVWRQLAPVFSNLNQIAKKMNGALFVDGAAVAEVLTMRETVKQLRAALLS